MVSDLPQSLSLYFLKGYAAITDDVARLPEDHSPESVAVGFVATLIALNPLVGVGALEGYGIEPHRLWVADDASHGVRVCSNEFPNLQRVVVRMVFRFGRNWSASISTRLAERQSPRCSSDYNLLRYGQWQ